MYCYSRCSNTLNRNHEVELGDIARGDTGLCSSVSGVSCYLATNAL